MKSYYVYIMASRRNGVLYVGVTNSIVHRAYQHRMGKAEGFTRHYQVKRLVYVETFADVGYAIEREKQIKGWNRDWKIRLIEKVNPNWDDLYEMLNC